MCEEKKEEKGDEKPAKTKEKPDQQKDNDKPDASSKKKDSEGPKNLGESPKAAEKETQTAREQKDEGAHASSKAGQAEVRPLEMQFGASQPAACVHSSQQRQRAASTWPLCF